VLSATYYVRGQTNKVYPPDILVMDVKFPPHVLHPYFANFVQLVLNDAAE
jgi:hypothetical protein